MLPLFYRHNKNSYLYDDSQALQINEIEPGYDIDLPMVIDTEFYSNPAFLLKYCTPRELLSIQIKGIRQKNEDATIFIPEKIQQEAAIENKIYLPYQSIENDEKSVVLPWINKYLENPIDFVEDLELTSKKIRDFEKKRNKLGTLTLVFYAHFAVAEIAYLGDIFMDTITKALTNKSPYGNSISMRKRLISQVKFKGVGVTNYIDIPVVTELNGNKFRLRIRIVDTCALHGVASYFDLVQNTNLGVDIEAIKKSLTQEEKENMKKVLFFQTEKFDAYARNDLHVYDILENNAKIFQTIRKRIGLNPDNFEPKLTIGATVADIFGSALEHQFKTGLQTKTLYKILEERCTKELKSNIKETKCLAAKVFGGRCRNNRPTLPKIEQLIIDGDVPGCYGKGQENQKFCIGIPVIEDFKIRARNNNYLTLREWLKHRGYGTENFELEYGKWHAVVFTKENLKIPQDLLISWVDYKLSEIAKNTDDSELDVKSGITKIFKHQVIDTVITHDFLEWLEHICSPSQRKELLDKLYVKAAIYYPKSGKIETFKELANIYDDWLEQNVTLATLKEDRSHKVIKTENMPTFYCEVNLGELLITQLLISRMLYKFVYGKKYCFEQLLKLNINTVFGILCSAFFDISNAVAANNITMRSRLMVWCVEKGLHMIMSITDGGMIVINFIPYAVKKEQQIYADKFVDLYALDLNNARTNRNIEFRPLGDTDKIWVDFRTDKLHIEKDNEITVLNKDDGMNWISETALEHLRNLFPGLSVLHLETTDTILNINDKKEVLVDLEEKYEYLSQEALKNLLADDSIKIDAIPQKVKKTGIYGLEVKDWYESGSFHGTSNYYLHNPADTADMEELKKRSTLKMRSYQKKRHNCLEQNDKGEIINTDYFEEMSPSEKFLKDNLWKTPEKIERSKIFSKNGILKPNAYAHNYEKWDNMGLFPGDNIVNYGLLKELSLSQFTFNTLEQYKSIEKEYLSNKRKYGQSYEGYFIDENGYLNYQEMIKTIDKLIRQGCYSINNKLDRSRHRHRKNMYHPQNKCYQTIKDMTPQLTTDSEKEYIVDLSDIEDILNDNPENYDEINSDFNIDISDIDF